MTSSCPRRFALACLNLRQSDSPCLYPLLPVCIKIHAVAAQTWNHLPGVHIECDADRSSALSAGIVIGGNAKYTFPFDVVGNVELCMIYIRIELYVCECVRLLYAHAQPIRSMDISVRRRYSIICCALNNAWKWKRQILRSIGAVGVRRIEVGATIYIHI